MSPASTPEVRTLGRLARAYGVQTSYYDIAHKRVPISPETLLAVLRALGAPLE